MDSVMLTGSLLRNDSGAIGRQGQGKVHSWSWCTNRL